VTAVTAPKRDDLAGALRERAELLAPTASGRRATWRESRFFVAAIVVLAVHGIDDSFLQPQPGTSAGDHLVSGLVPLAVLALAAWAYPRLPGGRRGALALVFGVFGIVAGAEAVHYTSQVGASGDDYSGMLAVPAGLLLLGLGAVTLWTTRRRNGNRPWRYLRRVLLAAMGVAVALFVVGPLSAGYLFTHLGRPVVPTANLGAGYEEVSFSTSDGLTLAGWYVPSTNGAAVIAFPGRNGPQAQTRMLARHGYGVLLFDRRGQGQSEGDPHAFGWEGEKDIKAAIAFLQRRPDVDPERIGGLGLSVGGELMLHAAAETDALKAVVSEGAGSRSIGEFRDMPDPSLVQHGYETMITAGLTLFSNSPPPPLMQDIIGRIAPRPVFLIWAPHGVDTEALNPEYFKAAGEPKTLWAIPEAKHVGGLAARPEEYEDRVIAFFDRALLGEAR
jgi:alpha/beta superfamily hydrolase